MAEILKSFLRPLRNILLPSSPPETAQTHEESERERNGARMKGFTYLKSMDEVMTWNEEEEDAIQRASIPLIRRPRSFLRGEGENEPKAKTMIIHDFGTAYHEYEASSPCSIGIDEEKFSLDGGQLRFCEFFVYFAHYLVSCPPPSWVDWCHCHGVWCLGTFIVEPQMEKEEMGRVFERDEEGFVVARVLGRMARWVGFEGWIVNIEGTFAESDWSEEAMVGFLEELKGYGVVVWYDALTTTNKISHQNALTPLNLPFSLASTAFLSNYTWTPSLISSSLSLAHQHNLDPQNLFFGIDIWAQNRPHSFLHPRLTWPLFNGGGTNTGFAVKKCAETGVSAGLFAPGWCWEHFSSTSDRRKVEESLWKGVELERSVLCDCKPGFWGGDVHRTKEYLGNGIMQYAEESVVGCEDGFWTGFDRAVGIVPQGEEVGGGKKIVSRLGAQGIMPLETMEGERDVWWSVDHERPGILSLVAAKFSDGETNRRYLKLYNLGVRIEEDTRLVIRYRRPHFSLPISIAFLLKIHSSSGETEEIIPLPETDDYNVPLSHTISPLLGRNRTVTEIGMIITGNLSSEQEILQLSSLSIGSPTSFPSTSAVQVANIQLKIEGRDQWKHGRLTWHLTNLPERQNEGYYWSDMTGPIAYFEVEIERVIMGRSYGLDFVLPDAAVEKWRGDGIVVELVGVLFGGARIRRLRVWLGKGIEESEEDKDGTSKR